MIHGYPFPLSGDPTLCGEPGEAGDRERMTCPKCIAICSGGPAFRAYMERLRQEVVRGPDKPDETELDAEPVDQDSRFRVEGSGRTRPPS